VIEQLKAQPVGADELQKAKNLEQSSFVFAQDSIFEEALQLGVWEMLGDYHLMDRYLTEIDKVTAADVQRWRKISGREQLHARRAGADRHPAHEQAAAAPAEPCGTLPRSTPRIRCCR